MNTSILEMRRRNSTTLGDKLVVHLSHLPAPLRIFLRNLLIAFTSNYITSRISQYENSCESLEDYLHIVRNIQKSFLRIVFSILQNDYEILDLLEKVSDRGLGLRYVVEIGTHKGGTFYLFCKAAKPDAQIITVDVEMPVLRKKLLESFAQPEQTSIIMKADSHNKQTVKQITDLLNRNKLDLLFIDGDHSYNGVKQDFLNYSPLVRSGGWIAFHDIVSYEAMGVIKFWREIKEEYEHFEIVENPNQTDYGIGVLIWE